MTAARSLARSAAGGCTAAKNTGDDPRCSPLRPVRWRGCPSRQREQGVVGLRHFEGAAHKRLHASVFVTGVERALPPPCFHRAPKFARCAWLCPLKLPCDARSEHAFDEAARTPGPSRRQARPACPSDGVRQPLRLTDHWMLRCRWPQSPLRAERRFASRRIRIGDPSGQEIAQGGLRLHR